MAIGGVQLVGGVSGEPGMTGDATVVAMGAEAEGHGADAVARIYNGGARAARLALLDGEPGGAWLMGGELKVLWTFTVSDDDRITGIRLLADPETLEELHGAITTGALASMAVRIGRGTRLIDNVVLAPGTGSRRM